MTFIITNVEDTFENEFKSTLYPEDPNVYIAGSILVSVARN